jgi:tetratricopeptide (TPR) repeat protein
VALFRKTGDLEATIHHMISLGELEMLNGNLQAAQSWLHKAVKASHNSTKLGTNRGVNDQQLAGIIALSQQLKNKTLLAFILQIYGRIAFARGEFEEAYAGLHKSIEIGQELGHRLVYFWSSTHLGYLLLQRGDVIEARDTFVGAALNFQKDQNVIGVLFSLEGMASLYVVIGKYDHAARLVGWADAMRKKIDDMRPVLEQADVDKIIVACLRKLGEIAFSDAYDEGQKMTLDEAVSLALWES